MDSVNYVITGDDGDHGKLLILKHYNDQLRTYRSSSGNHSNEELKAYEDGLKNKRVSQLVPEEDRHKIPEEYRNKKIKNVFRVKEKPEPEGLFGHLL